MGITLLPTGGTITLIVSSIIANTVKGTSMVSISSSQPVSATSPTKLQFSLRSLLVLCAWWSFILTLFVNAMPMSYRIAMACMMTCPFLVAWRGSKYNASLLGGVATGVSMGVLTFLGLCAMGQLEPFWVHVASAVTIGFVSGVIGWIIAPKYVSSDEPGDATLIAKSVIFRRHVLSVSAFSAVLFAVFLIARGYNAHYQNVQSLHCSNLTSQGAVVHYRPLQLPAFATRLLGGNAKLASRVEFFKPISPDTAYSLGELQTVSSVSLIGHDLDDDSLSRIPESLNLMDMCLGDTMVSNDGLEMLLRWPRLRTLALNKAPVGDDAIPYIAKLRSLERLQILSTKFSDNGTEKLKEILPTGCQVTAGEWPDSQPESL